MEKIQVKVKKMRENANLPRYGSACAAAADLYASLDTPRTIDPGETAMIGTGVAVEIPEGYVGLVYARSGIACKRGLAPANKVGVVDSDYRGEIFVALHNHGTQAQTVENGERIAQLMIAPYYTADFCESAELSDTTRGEGGVGSTGTK